MLRDPALSRNGLEWDAGVPDSAHSASIRVEEPVHSVLLLSREVSYDAAECVAALRGMIERTLQPSPLGWGGCLLDLWACLPMPMDP